MCIKFIRNKLLSEDLYMKKIILILFLMLCTAGTYAQSTVTYYPQNTPFYYNNGGPQRPKIPLDELSALEKYTYNKTYTREYPLARLERLETSAFGAIQQGNLSTRFKNVENALLARENYSPNYYRTSRRNIWGNLADYFIGQPTGITPSITSPYYQGYNPIYGQNYGNQRYEQFSNGIFGGGYNLMNQSLGNGSSIRILP